MPPAKMRGDGRKAKDPKKTLFRLLSYLKKHVGVLTIVMLCILANAFATTQSATALGKLVDQYILPMVATGSTDFGPLLQYLMYLVVILVIALIMIPRTLENISIIGVLRGSGDTRTAFLIDLGCQWLIGLPLGYLSAFVWKWPVLAVYAVMCTDSCVKDILCVRRILRGKYIHNLTEQSS